MRNRVLNVGALLLLAAAITVGTSWMFALYAVPGKFTIDYTPPAPGSALSMVSSVPPDWKVNTQVRRNSLGLQYQLVSETSWMGSKLGMMEGSKNRSLERVQIGWPLGAFEWIGEMDYRCKMPAAGDFQIDLLRGITPPWRDEVLSMGARRKLPLMPLLPGFVVDTVVFAALLLCISLGIRQIRSMRRRRLGLCTRCGYPVAAGKPCSECGLDWEN